MKTLIVERDERGVVSVELNRPEKKNAIDYRMFEELLEVFDEISRSDTDRVLVLSGAGGNFSAGADLGAGRRARPPPARPHALLRLGGARAAPAAAALDREGPRRRRRRRAQPRARLRSDRGLSTARFSEIFARRGLSLDVGGSWLLPRLVGLHRAKELALLAEIVSAEEAERIGLVNRVVPDARARRAGRRLGGPARRGPAARARDEQAAAQSGVRGRAGRGARGRGHGPDRERRDRGHEGGASGLLPETRAQVLRALADRVGAGLQLHAHRPAISDTSRARGPHPLPCPTRSAPRSLVCLCAARARSGADVRVLAARSRPSRTPTTVLDASVALGDIPVTGTYEVDLDVARTASSPFEVGPAQLVVPARQLSVRREPELRTRSR